MNDSFLHQLNTNSTKISESELCCFVYLVGMTRFALLSRSFEQSEIRTFDTKQAEQKRSACFVLLVGMTRFELATSGPPDRCATGLRHIPLLFE